MATSQPCRHQTRRSVMPCAWGWKKEKEGTENYIIGGEESYGLMVGSKLRDKDAVSAVAILCEMAAYEKSRGKTLFEKLLELYVKFGYYQEHLISITKKGRDGQQQI